MKGEKVKKRLKVKGEELMVNGKQVNVKKRLKVKSGNITWRK